MATVNLLTRITVITMAALTLVGVGPAFPQSTRDHHTSSLGMRALDYIEQQAAESRAAFHVYRDADSGFNHGFPSGVFPGGPGLTRIGMDPACVYDPFEPERCATDATRLDRQRGTVLQVRFAPLARGEFAGLHFEEPEGYVGQPSGIGYDLRRATRLCFEALSPSPALRVQFGLAGRVSAFREIPDHWTPICLDLTMLGFNEADLAEVHLLFTVVTNDRNGPKGGTLLLDNIRYEPVPQRLTEAPSLPMANHVLGVVPAVAVRSGRVPVPPDQVLANTATTYESALAVLALLNRSAEEDLTNARAIANALVYALEHDNDGLPLPTAPDGSRGLHNAMSSGDLPLYNDQGPDAGQAGQVRLAGFSLGSDRCGPTHFCAVLDGATGGNNAFAILALAAAYREFQDLAYLEAARTIGRWIHSTLHDGRSDGFGGYFLGYADGGTLPRELIRGKSVENNADIYRAFSGLAAISDGLGLIAETDTWESLARIAGDFVLRMYDPAQGRFHAGTVPAGSEAEPGISPDGPRSGQEIVNTFDFLDTQTFPILALATSPRYRDAIDWRRPMHWVAARFPLQVSAGGREYRGFGLTSSPTVGPNGIAWEFTAQAVLAMRCVDSLYGETQFAQLVSTHTRQLRRAQTGAPFADGHGLMAATLENGDRLPPHEHCLSTPFQCIPQRVGLAASAWAVFADTGANSFSLPPDQDWQCTGVGQKSSGRPFDRAHTAHSRKALSNAGGLPRLQADTRQVVQRWASQHQIGQRQRVTCPNQSVRQSKTSGIQLAPHRELTNVRAMIDDTVTPEKSGFEPGSVRSVDDFKETCTKARWDNAC